TRRWSRTQRRSWASWRRRSSSGDRHAMSKRVEGKCAIVVGGGQTPGRTIGNGRATAMVLGREGAHVWVVDRSLASAQETVDQIQKNGGDAWAFAADATKEEDVKGG